MACSLTGGLAAAPTPHPTPPPELKSLAEKIDAAKGPAEQDGLVDQTPPALLEGRSFRDALVRIGYQRQLEGNYPAAERMDRTIIRLGERRHDPAMTAAGQVLEAAVLRETGDYAGGLALLNAALAFNERDPKPTVEKMSVYAEIGITYLQQGNFRRAFTNLEHQLQLAREMHDPRSIIPALNSLGELFRTQGQPERALEFYEQARQEVGDDSAWNMSFIFNNIGMAYQAMGDTTQAIENIERAKAVAEKVKFPARLLTAQTVLGELQLQAGQAETAGHAFQQSLELSRTLHDKANEARALLGLAHALRDQKKFAEALGAAQQSVGFYQELGEHEALAHAQTELGRCWLSLGKKDEAAAAFTAGIGEVEQVRGQLVGGAEEAESFLETHIAPYQEMVALLVDRGQPEEAFATAQRASARALLDILARGKNAAPAQPNEATNRHRAELETRVAEANRHLLEARKTAQPSAARLAALQEELRHARADREIFAAESAAMGESATPTPLTPAAAAPLLEDGKTAVLKFLVARDRTFLFVLRAKEGKPALEIFTIARTRDELAAQTAAFRKRLAERDLAWQEPARALFAQLLQKSEPLWRSATSLTIIPDGPLWELPFQALQDAGKHCLLEEHAITYAPSLSFLAEAPEENDRSSTGPAPRLFALANPAAGTFSGPLTGEAWEPLPAADQQVAALQKLYAPERSLVLTGPAARESTFKEHAADFDILHFATHGVINDHAPLYSYLLMAQENLAPNEDGLLEAWELMGMKLHARLAVLSACETARGKISDGEGVIGLAWAFLAAGCPAEVVSQWKVESESDSGLMVDFHRRLQAGAPVAEALRQASLALAKNPAYRHPFYWAPFVLIGKN